MQKNRFREVWSEIELTSAPKPPKLKPPAEQIIAFAFKQRGFRWRCFAVKDSRVWWCWSTTPNDAGYFLGWRQTRNRQRDVVRDRITAHKRRSAAKALALRCYYQERNGQ